MEQRQIVDVLMAWAAAAGLGAGVTEDDLLAILPVLSRRWARRWLT